MEGCDFGCDFDCLPDGIAVLAIGPQRDPPPQITIRRQASCLCFPAGDKEDSYNFGLKYPALVASCSGSFGLCPVFMEDQPLVDAEVE